MGEHERNIVKEGNLMRSLMLTEWEEVHCIVGESYGGNHISVNGSEKNFIRS